MNKFPERPSNFAMQPAADKRDSKDVDMGFYNKQHYTIYSDEEKTSFFIYFF